MGTSCCSRTDVPVLALLLLLLLHHVVLGGPQVLGGRSASAREQCYSCCFCGTMDNIAPGSARHRGGSFEKGTGLVGSLGELQGSELE